MLSHCNLFSNFTGDLWLAILITTIIVLTLKIFSTRLRLKFKFTSLVSTFWFLIISILLNFYGNLIAVDLLIPDTVEVAPFESIEELVEKIQSKRLVLLCWLVIKIRLNFTTNY